MPETRVPRRRRFLVCEPRHFAVQYAINPWMQPDVRVDVDLAQEQWQALIRAYRSHGHSVDTLEPVAGLPDMVFAASRYGYLYRSDDGGDTWRKLWREFGEVSSILWVAHQGD